MEGTSREPIIVVEDLLAAYGDNVILKDVSFDVAPGEILAIVGGSGCGKSTLLKYMIGLYRAEHGRILVGGTDIMAVDDATLDRVRLGMGVLFQSGALVGSMTLGENVALPLMEHTDLAPVFIEQIVKAKLAMVHLAGYENHYPSELSGGMKKRAGFARAMALDPAILFFDEPSAGLDPVTSAELYELIKRMNTHLHGTMIIVTHDLDLIDTIVDRVIMLDGTEKGIIATGTPQALRDHARDLRVHEFFRRRAKSAGCQ